MQAGPLVGMPQGLRKKRMRPGHINTQHGQPGIRPGYLTLDLHQCTETPGQPQNDKATLFFWVT